MVPEHHIEDEPCPVTDQMLGQIIALASMG
jgi:hypothetical protein